MVVMDEYTNILIDPNANSIKNDITKTSDLRGNSDYKSTTFTTNAFSVLNLYSVRNWHKNIKESTQKANLNAKIDSK